MISVEKNLLLMNLIAVMIKWGKAEFTMPTCNRIYCEEPHSDYKMQVTCTNQYWYDSKCTATCVPGYILTGSSSAICLGDGSVPVGEWLHDNTIWQAACVPMTCDAAEKIGLVRIHPKPYANDGIEVYCKGSQHVDGRWIVIQRRINGSVDFYRTYDEYVKGFGSKNGEFWLGLEYIHQLTAADEYDLLVELEDFGGNRAYETYSKFSLGDSSTNYTLKVQNPQGSAGDALAGDDNWSAVGQQFTTYDSDNDESSRNCAQRQHGAWWYKNCADANLNGRYYDTEQDEWDGIVWWQWKDWTTLKSSTMKIRKK